MSPRQQLEESISGIRGLDETSFEIAGLDESRQVDELINCEDSTVRGESLARDEVQLVIQRQHRLDSFRRLVRTNAPTVHGTAVSVFLQIAS